MILIIRQALQAVFAFTMIYIWAQPLLFSIMDSKLFKSWLINSACPNKINTKVYLFISLLRHHTSLQPLEEALQNNTDEH